MYASTTRSPTEIEAFVQLLLLYSARGLSMSPVNKHRLFSGGAHLFDGLGGQLVCSLVKAANQLLTLTTLSVWWKPR